MAIPVAHNISGQISEEMLLTICHTLAMLNYILDRFQQMHAIQFGYGATDRALQQLGVTAGYREQGLDCLGML
jgi:hypothetical protein